MESDEKDLTGLRWNVKLSQVVACLPTWNSPFSRVNVVMSRPRTDVKAQGSARPSMEDVKKLVQDTVRAFYDPAQVILLDYLVRSKDSV
jgi:hypothetical protein